MRPTEFCIGFSAKIKPQFESRDLLSKTAALQNCVLVVPAVVLGMTQGWGFADREDACEEAVPVPGRKYSHKNGTRIVCHWVWSQTDSHSKQACLACS